MVCMDTTVKTLTAAERLQLVNQLRILEILDPDHAVDYAEDREIIAKGYTAQYNDVFTGVYDEMPFDECTYVYDVLDCHRVLIQSFNALPDKQGLTPDDVKFQGFDGNNESKRLALAEHLKKQGKWTETLVGGLNSHSMSTMSRYPRMLANFKPISDKISSTHGDWQLTADEIRKVIS